MKHILLKALSKLTCSLVRTGKTSHGMVNDATSC